MTTDALFTWLLSDPFGDEKLALLVLCMIGIYVLSTQLAWRIKTTSVDGRFLAIVRHSWFGRWAVKVLRLFYYVGVPLTVLWRGALYPDVYREMGIATTYADASFGVGRWDVGLPLLLLGLGEATSVRYLGAGVAIGGAALGVLLVVWIWYARLVLTQIGLEETEIAGESGFAAVPWWIAIREALYAQLLWGLYRGSAAMVIADRLKAASIGLALVAFCWVLDPRRRRDLFGSRGYLVVQDWLFALFTTFLSLAVQSLWFLVMMHALWLWFSGQVLAHLYRTGAHKLISRSSQP